MSKQQEQQPDEVRKLTITRTTYGVSKRPVIKLNYNDGGEVPTYEVHLGRVDADIFTRMIRAQAAGLELEFKGFDIGEDEEQ